MGPGQGDDTMAGTADVGGRGPDVAAQAVPANWEQVVHAQTHPIGTGDRVASGMAGTAATTTGSRAANVDQFEDAATEVSPAKGSPTGVDAKDGADEPDHDLEGVAMVLVAWTPSELSCSAPDKLNLLLQYFAKLKPWVNFLGLRVWHLDPDACEELRFAARSALVREFVESLVRFSATTLAAEFISGNASSRSSPRDLPTAMAQLHQAPNDYVCRELQKKRRADANRMLDQHVIQPLWECAMTSTDPVARNLYVAAAGMSRLFHQQVTSLGERLGSPSAAQGAENIGMLDASQIKGLVDFADRFVDIMEAIKQCDSETMTVSAARISPSPNIRRLPHSG
jgi:hypothetical protein